MTELKKGSVWWINHTRKGPFVGKIVSDDGEFATVEILQGRVFYLSSSNNESQVVDGLGKIGSSITVRKSLASFLPAKKTDVGNWVAA